MRTKKIVFDLKNIVFRKHAINFYKCLISYEHKSVEEKKNILFTKSKQLLIYAYKYSKFYKNYYDKNGFHPSMFKSMDDWKRVPILEKSMIRDNFDNIITIGSNMNTLRVAKTGGSTGTPLKVLKDKKIPVEVLGWRSLFWWGLSPYLNHGVVNRSVTTNRWQRYLNKLIWWPTQRIFLDASSVTEKNLSDFVNKIDRKKIKFLVGYCGSLEKIADYIIRNNIKIKSIKLIWSTTSPLTQSVRIKLEKAFNCNVMDQYGSIEVFHIAVQKPNENYLTVNDDYVHLDIVNSNNELINSTGEIGDILVTDLYSKKFPIIKYRLGDKSRMLYLMENSSDGFSKIDFVKGRISDLVSFQDGSYMDGAFLTTICDGFEDVIDSYQIYQDNTYKIFFRIVLVQNVNKSNSRLQFVINNLIKLINDRAEIEIQFVDNIPDDRGKRRFIISDIVKK